MDYAQSLLHIYLPAKLTGVAYLLNLTIGLFNFGLTYALLAI